MPGQNRVQNNTWSDVVKYFLMGISFMLIVWAGTFALMI